MDPTIATVRVLHVVSGDLWAGAESQVAALLAQMRHCPGLELHVAVLNPGELERRVASLGIPVTVLDEGRLSTLAIFRGIRRLIRAYEPHVVHTHRTKENVLGGLAAWVEGRRASIRTAHGADEHHPPLWRLDKQLYRVLDALSARYWQQAVVAVSEQLARSLRLADSRMAVETVLNGIDAAAYQPLRARRLSRRPGDPFRVAFLGRLVPVKRVDLFLEVAADLCGRFPGRYRFDIMGDGPLRGELESRVRELSLEDSVTFHGFRVDAVELLAGCDVLVFTSDHEGTPMAALESLAVGVPVVARAVGGLVEMLSGASGGRLVQDEQPRAIAEGIRGLLDGPQVPAELPARYRVTASADRYMEVYRRLARV